MIIGPKSCDVVFAKKARAKALKIGELSDSQAGLK